MNLLEIERLTPEHRSFGRDSLKALAKDCQRHRSECLERMANASDQREVTWLQGRASALRELAAQLEKVTDGER